MRWLLFLSRLAFICGLFFLLALSLRISNWTHDEAISSTIILIGYLMGLIVVPITVFCYLVTLVIRKKLFQIVPAWLVIANFIFLLVLVYYIFSING